MGWLCRLSQSILRHSRPENWDANKIDGKMAMHDPWYPESTISQSAPVWQTAVPCEKWALSVLCNSPSGYGVAVTGKVNPVLQKSSVLSDARAVWNRSWQSREVEVKAALPQPLQMCCLPPAARVLYGVQSFAFHSPAFGKFCCSSWRLGGCSALSFAGVPRLWSHAGLLTVGLSHRKPRSNSVSALKQHIICMFIIHVCMHACVCFAGNVIIAIKVAIWLSSCCKLCGGFQKPTHTPFTECLLGELDKAGFQWKQICVIVSLKTFSVGPVICFFPSLLSWFLSAFIS